MQLKRRVLLGAGGVSALLEVSAFPKAAASGEASAAFVAFNEPGFNEAQKAGRVILVHIFATWCEICARQALVLNKLLAEPAYKDVVVFRVNFDTQKDVMRRFGARVQSTLIAYRGTKEVGRSVDETQPEWIEDMVPRAGGGAS